MITLIVSHCLGFLIMFLYMRREKVIAKRVLELFFLCIKDSVILWGGFTKATKIWAAALIVFYPRRREWWLYIIDVQRNCLIPPSLFSKGNPVFPSEHKVMFSTVFLFNTSKSLVKLAGVFLASTWSTFLSDSQCKHHNWSIFL